VETFLKCEIIFNGGFQRGIKRTNFSWFLGGFQGGITRGNLFAMLRMTRDIITCHSVNGTRIGLDDLNECADNICLRHQVVALTHYGRRFFKSEKLMLKV